MFVILSKKSGRGAARLARAVRVGEVGGSNPLAPTIKNSGETAVFSLRERVGDILLDIESYRLTI